MQMIDFVRLRIAGHCSQSIRAAPIAQVHFCPDTEHRSLSWYCTLKVHWKLKLPTCNAIFLILRATYDRADFLKAEFSSMAPPGRL